MVFQSQEPYYLARFPNVPWHHDIELRHIVSQGYITSTTCMQALSPRREGDLPGDEPLVLRRTTYTNIYEFTEDQVREIVDAVHFSRRRVSLDDILQSVLGVDL